MNFEEYAKQYSMKGKVSHIYNNFFRENIIYDYKNNDNNLKILDFGCGDGRYYHYFRKFFNERNIYGIEISKKRIENCREIGWNNVFLIKNNQLPFSSNMFDVINFMEVIEHIPKSEIDNILKELHRILKPNGKIIIGTPNYPIKRLGDYMGWIQGHRSNPSDDLTHITKYNFKSLYNLLNKYGYVVYLLPTGGFFYKATKTNFFSIKIIGFVQKI